jgi:hypothetical protein
VSQYSGPGSPGSYAAGRWRTRRGARRLDAIVAFLFDRGGKRRIEDRHLPTKGPQIRHASTATSVRWNQLRDRTSPFRDHDLTALLHLVQERREVLTSRPDAGNAHATVCYM